MRSKGLAGRIVRLQVLVVAAVLVIGTLLFLRLLNETLISQYERRVLAIAESVAAQPEIVAAVQSDDPNGVVQPRAEAVRRATGALFVVVTNDRGVRLSHPNAALIGHRVSTDPSQALAGQTVVAIERGTLGDSARAKVPLRDASGAVIGEVSVGISATEISQRLRALLPSALAYTAVALVLGVAASVVLGRRIKRDTFGLEPRDIATLLQQREALLHGVREGVIAFNDAGRVTLVNDEARRLLALRVDPLGQEVQDLVAPGRLRDLLAGTTGSGDDVVLTQDACLLVNRRPAEINGHLVGWVVTLRDRTEQEGLLRELDSVRGLSDALRAQQHEFANRLHVISGLLELGDVDEARDFVADVGGRTAARARDLQERVADPRVAALLLAKSAVAVERGVDLRISDDTSFDVVLDEPEPVLTVLGNLIDNAVDAVSDAAGQRAPTPFTRGPREVLVALDWTGSEVVVVVSDTGPGVPDGALGQIFVDGWSTKPEGDRRRGLGLALVQRLVHRRGGSIHVTQGPAPTFRVRLPLTATRVGATR
ncbi:MAG: ATP-binding protein [Actinomycetes bacterium]